MSHLDDAIWVSFGCQALPLGSQCEGGLDRTFCRQSELPLWVDYGGFQIQELPAAVSAIERIAAVS